MYEIWVKEFLCFLWPHREMVSQTIIKWVWFMWKYVIQNYDMPTFLLAQLSFLLFSWLLTTKTHFHSLVKKIKWKGKKKKLFYFIFLYQILEQYLKSLSQNFYIPRRHKSFIHVYLIIVISLKHFFFYEKIVNLKLEKYRVT